MFLVDEFNAKYGYHYAPALEGILGLSVFLSHGTAAWAIGTLAACSLATRNVRTVDPPAMLGSMDCCRSLFLENLWILFFGGGHIISRVSIVCHVKMHTDLITVHGYLYVLECYSNFYCKIALINRFKL